MFGAVAAVMIVAAELARAASARVTKLALSRNRIKLAVLCRTNGRRSARLIAILVGPFGAYLALCVIVFVVFRVQGVPGNQTIVREVLPDYPAVGQLFVGDEIVDVDDRPLTRGSQQLQEAFQAANGAPVTLGVVYEGERRVVRLVARRRVDPYGQAWWQIGVSLMPKPAYDSGLAATRAIDYPIKQAGYIWRGWVDIFLGRDDLDPGGPVRISTELQKSPTASSAMWLALIFGVYFLIALCVFDLVRAIIALARR